MSTQTLADLFDRDAFLRLMAEQSGSWRDLALDIGVSPQDLEDYKTLKKRPSVKVILAMTEFFGCEIDALLILPEQTEKIVPGPLEVPKALIDNATEFIKRAAQSQKDAATNKFTCIELNAGLELLVKAALASQHWTLVLEDVDRAALSKLLLGDVKTVDFANAQQRLNSVCGISIEAKARASLDALRRLRNRYMHFTHHPDEKRDSIIIKSAWDTLLYLMSVLPLPAPSTELLTAIVDGISDSATAVKGIVEDELQALRLEEALQKGFVLWKCYYCDKQSCLLGDGWPRCDNEDCLKSYAPEDYADLYARDVDFHWKHHRHGPDDEVWVCEDCGEVAVVPLESELCRVLLRLARYKDDQLMLEFAPPTPRFDMAQVCLSCLHVVHPGQHQNSS